MEISEDDGDAEEQPPKVTSKIPVEHSETLPCTVDSVKKWNPCY